ncbi:glycosyl transferase family protein [Halorubrum distributum JCM 13561]|uniref:Glycosyl transferase family protein n=1 Tax=Halorubrum distributum JCM 13561 TaxID=1227483 RepID=M0NUQ1_9EURY|nr:glycosyltransferase family 2 protein [Halorubrum litoreum]EMA61298.1 glycosyl transferase family protein [Halorubrum litoreum JCM 13561]
MELVSVVIPTYNRSHILSRAIESVLNQSYSNFELIIVDDGSTDGTKEMISQYSDSRIQFIELGSNKGANAARNEGIRKSNGKYISFLDSDDEFAADHLEKAISYLEQAPRSAKGVYTSQKEYLNGTFHSSSVAKKVLDSPKQIIRRYSANGFSSFTFSSDIFDNIELLDEELEAYQDMDFLIRFLQYYELHPISDFLVKYHIHDEQISSDPDRRLSALEQLISKHKKTIEKSNTGYLHYSRGFQYVEKNSMNKAKTEFAAAIKSDPIKFRYYFQFFSSLFGYSGFKTINNMKSKLVYLYQRFDLNIFPTNVIILELK